MNIPARIWQAAQHRLLRWNGKLDCKLHSGDALLSRSHCRSCPLSEMEPSMIASSFARGFIDAVVFCASAALVLLNAGYIPIPSSLSTASAQTVEHAYCLQDSSKGIGGPCPASCQFITTEVCVPKVGGGFGQCKSFDGECECIVKPVCPGKSSSTGTTCNCGRGC